MRIRRFFLTAYGPFTGAELDFDAPQGTVHVVFGENEAGKSSSLRALQSLCFGIEERSTDNHLHPHDQMLVGADLVLESGESNTFFRRKGRKNTLVDASKAVIPDEELDRYLCGVGEEGFKSLYYLGYGRLTEGADDLLKENGELGRLLAEARSDKSLKRVQTLLADRASSLFKGTARANTVIDKALIEYTEARKPLKKGDVARYAEINLELAQLEEAMAAKDKQREQLLQTGSQLQRALASIGPVFKLKQIQAELDELGEVPVIHSAIADRFELAYTQSVDAKREIETRQAEVRWAQEQIESHSFDNRLIERESEIQQLLSQVSQIESHLKDIPQRKREADDDRLDAKSALTRFWPDATFDSTSVPIEGAQLRLTALNTERTKLNSERSSALDALKAASSAKKNAELQLTVLTQQSVSPEVRAAIRTGRAALGQEAQLRKLEDEIKRLTPKVQSLQSQLGGNDSSIQTFLAKQLPNEDAVEQTKSELDAIDGTLARLKASLAETEAERLNAENTRIELLSVGEVASEVQLLQARGQRDETWTSLRRAVENADKQSIPPELPGRFETELQLTDAISDRLRDASDRAAELAVIESKLMQLETKKASLDEQLRTAVEEREAAWQRWRTRWMDQGITPDQPASMLAWLRSYSELGSMHHQILLYREEIESYSQDINKAKAELARLLGEHPNQPLSDLIAVADQLEATANQALGQSKTLSAQVRSNEETIEDSTRRLAQVEQDLKEWSRKWEREMKSLSLPPDLPVDRATEAVDALRKANESAGTADIAEERVTKMQRDVDEFNGKATSLLNILADDLLSFSSLDAARQLQTRLNTAKRVATTSETHQQGLNRASAELSRASATLASAQSEIDELLAETDLASAEELATAITQSRKAVALKKEAQAARVDIQVQLHGEDLEGWIESVGWMDQATLQSQIDETSSNVRLLNQEISQLNTQIGEKQAQLKVLDTDKSLIDAQYAAESALARVKSSVRPYLVAMLAESLIRAQMEEYRKANQGPILRKASEIFSTLTNHSFAELMAEVDDKDQVVLIAVRVNSTKGITERLRVDALSSATRVALYLALRLACIYHQVEHREGVPFVADDILLDFDDARARKVMGELGKLAERTQVVMFTHHQHLVQIAEAELGHRCRVQSLAR